MHMGGDLGVTAKCGKMGKLCLSAQSNRGRNTEFFQNEANYICDISKLKISFSAAFPFVNRKRV